ncbi:hypothetical protein [Polaromonas sp. CG_23.6]|nr:hypothetical protein [Polaromonas sp. CG_23.6]MDH6186732.1 hypothetical protein [Polaromonas sp. CG_23.6]
MILSPYFPEFKEINALRAQAGYGFMKMNDGCEVYLKLTVIDAILIVFF